MKTMGLFPIFALRLIAVVLWTGVLHSIIRFCQLFHLADLHRKRPSQLIGLWGKGMVQIMGIRIHRVNERSGPLGDIIVSNHLGFLDIPILLSLFPAVFIIKAEIGRIPLSGRALKNQRHIFVERGDSVSRHQAREALIEALENGDRVIVFPEGRGSPGAERLPFKPYSFFATKQLSKTVEVVVIDYLPDRSALAWDITKPMFSQFVRLLGKPQIHVSVEFLSVKVPDNPAKEAAFFKELIEQKLRENDTAKRVR